MKDFFDCVMPDGNPYTHPMLVPVTAFGAPVEHSETKTDPIGGERQEPEQGGEKIVKERLHLFDSTK